MAQVAIRRPPCDLVVMAHAAKLAIDDVGHQHIVAPSAHLEAKFGMADFAAKADSMKPMRKNHRPHALFFCALV